MTKRRLNKYIRQLTSFKERPELLEVMDDIPLGLVIEQTLEEGKEDLRRLRKVDKERTGR